MLTHTMAQTCSPYASVVSSANLRATVYVKATKTNRPDQQLALASCCLGKPSVATRLPVRREPRDRQKSFTFHAGARPPSIRELAIATHRPSAVPAGFKSVCNALNREPRIATRNGMKGEKGKSQKKAKQKGSGKALENGKLELPGVLR